MGNEPDLTRYHDDQYVWARPRRMGWPTILVHRYPEGAKRKTSEIVVTQVRVAVRYKVGEKPDITRVAVKGRWGTGRPIEQWMSLSYSPSTKSLYGIPAPDWIMELAADAIERSRS